MKYKHSGFKLKSSGFSPAVIALGLLYALILISAGCKCSTDPKPADCETGYHPCENDNTICCLDSTSHNVDFWEIDTLGSPLTWSVLHDVAIIDEDNIWAVGEIIINEDDGTQTTYNAAHWDGSEWELMAIVNTATLRGIQVFEENDIWVTSGVIKHWDGQDWIIFNLWEMGILVEGDGSPMHIWGTSSENIFFIGDNGTIVHYDGNTFTRMDSGTDVTLTAITGTGYDNVWVSGWVNSNGDYRTVLLHFDGNSWRKVVEYSPSGGIAQPDSLTGKISGVYTSNNEGLYVLTNRGLYHCMTETNGDCNLTGNPSDIFIYGWNDFSGLSENDLFWVGGYTNIVHWNGSTFHLYEEIPYIGTPHAVDLVGNLVVIVGFHSSTAQAYVIRGYR